MNQFDPNSPFRPLRVPGPPRPVPRQGPVKPVHAPPMHQPTQSNWPAVVLIVGVVVILPVICLILIAGLGAIVAIGMAVRSPAPQTRAVPTRQSTPPAYSPPSANDQLQRFQEEHNQRMREFMSESRRAAEERASGSGIGSEQWFQKQREESERRRQEMLERMRVPPSTPPSFRNTPGTRRQPGSIPSRPNVPRPSIPRPAIPNIPRP